MRRLWRLAVAAAAVSLVAGMAQAQSPATLRVVQLPWLTLVMNRESVEEK